MGGLLSYGIKGSVELLIEAGADTGLKDHAGHDAADYAKDNGQDHIVAFLERIEGERLRAGINAHLEELAAPKPSGGSIKVGAATEVRLK